MWLPTNDDTKTILYDTQFLKSAPGRYPALKWSVTKIEDTAVEGISKFTMAQTQFDPEKDNVELGIANYYDSAVPPELPETEHIPFVSDLEITYSGAPAVRAGGGFKKFVLKSRIDGELIETTDAVMWSIDFPTGDPDQLVTSVELNTFVNTNIFKVKCLDDYSLIGKTFTITATTENDSTSLICEVISL